MMIPPYGPKESFRRDSLAILYLRTPLQDPHIRNEMSLLVAESYTVAAGFESMILIKVHRIHIKVRLHRLTEQPQPEKTDGSSG